MNRKTCAEYLHNKISSAPAVRFALELVEVNRKRRRKIDGNGFTATVVISNDSVRAKFNIGHGGSFRRFALCRIGYNLDALARVQVVACQMAGYKLSNQLESVDIKIKLAFSVQTFERNNYIRTFNVCDQINSWPGTKKDIARLFKAITAFLPKPFTRFSTSALRTNPIQLAFSKLSSDDNNSFASDFSFHD